MRDYFLRRILLIPPTLLGITVVVFMITRVVPGGPLERAIMMNLNIPDPELLIRTSGEMRISNFLLWQIAYTELYFTQKLWPDFRKADLHKALREFQNRERRFGKISEQIKT